MKHSKLKIFTKTNDNNDIYYHRIHFLHVIKDILILLK